VETRDYVITEWREMISAKRLGSVLKSNKSRKFEWVKYGLRVGECPSCIRAREFHIHNINARTRIGIIANYKRGCGARRLAAEREMMMMMRPQSLLAASNNNCWR
jgi:hypothetical protein